MASVTSGDGETWDSIAESNQVPLTSLLMANGIDPATTPDALQPGSLVQLPDDPPEACVAPGHDHSLDVVPGETSLWVRLDLSADDAASDEGSLRLYSQDGSTDVTMPIVGHFASNGDSVDILFDSVDPDGMYSLEYVDGDGNATPLFCERTVTQIDDAADYDGPPADSEPSSDDSDPSPPDSTDLV